MSNLNKSVGLGHKDNFEALYDAISTGKMGLGLQTNDTLMNRAVVLDSINAAYDEAVKSGKEYLADVENALPDTPDSVSVPLGALNYIDPEIVEIIKAPMASDLIGYSTVRGVWGTKTIQIQTKEPRGKTVPYVGKPIGSTSGVNYTADIIRGVYYHQDSWSLNDLDISEAALARRPILPDSQAASIFTIKKTNDEIFFKGVDLTSNGGAKVEGLLNATGLSAYKNVTGGTWAAAVAAGTPEVILEQIAVAFADINTASNGHAANELYGDTGLGPNVGKLKLIVDPTNQGLLMQPINEYGLTVMDRLKKVYNNRIEVISSVFMAGANNGASAFYLIYESPFGARTVLKPYVEEVRLYPIVNLHATQEQLIASAVSGAIVQRPYFVARYTGI